VRLLAGAFARHESDDTNTSNQLCRAWTARIPVCAARSTWCSVASSTLNWQGHVREQRIGQEVIFLDLNLLLHCRRFVQFPLTGFRDKILMRTSCSAKLPVCSGPRRRTNLVGSVSTNCSNSPAVILRPDGENHFYRGNVTGGGD